MSLKAVAVGLLAVMASPAGAKPGIIEIDLIFPRNETYAPTAVLPIVFAIQDPSNASASLGGLGLGWSLIPLDGSVDLDQDNDMDDDDAQDRIATGNLVPGVDAHSLGPHVWDLAVGLTTKQTAWMLAWSPLLNNCTRYDHDPAGAAMDAQPTTLFFTIAADATAANASSADSLPPPDCAQGLQSYLLNVTADAGRAENSVDAPSCGFASDADGPFPVPDPCRVRLEADDARSILAAATDVACHARNSVVSCPSESAAVAGRGLLLLSMVAGVSAFTALVL